MPRQPTTLAKLTRPKLFGVVHRDRLFRQLDEERRNRSVVWIAGPPGAGKTALTASYLEARNLSGIWYQVDGGDADPATFFHYLALAGRTTADRSAYTCRSLRLSLRRTLPDLQGAFSANSLPACEQLRHWF